MQADRGGSLPVQLIGVDVDADERTGEVGSRRAGRVEVVGLTELGADGEHDVGLREGRVTGRNVSVVPMLRGWLSGRVPLALTVMPTGAPSLSATAAASAPAATAPPPSSSIGR